jgi:hypothetical protein
LKGEPLSAKIRRKVIGAVILLLGSLIAIESTIQLLDYPSRPKFEDAALQQVDAQAFSIQNSIMLLLGYAIGLAGLGLMIYRPGGRRHRRPSGSSAPPNHHTNPSSTPAERLRQELETELGPDEGFYAQLSELARQRCQRGA